MPDDVDEVVPRPELDGNGDFHSQPVIDRGHGDAEDTWQTSQALGNA